METVLYNVLLSIQIAAIFILFGEIIYVSALKPSKFQTDTILLSASTMIMLVGYLVEIYADCLDAAVYGAAIAYIGKPFALLMSLIFVSDYCARPLPKKLVFILALVGASFPILVFNNGYVDEATGQATGHLLYYAEMDFDINKTFSPMTITERGPLYFTYTVYLIGMFLTILYFVISEFVRAKKTERKQLVLIGCMFVSTIIGYLLYMFGLTGGYDTTMTGAAVGTLFLTLVFFKYRLMDTMTLAQENALKHASNGILVFNNKNQVVYSNAFADDILRVYFTLDELLAFAENESERVAIVKKGDPVLKEERIFEVKGFHVRKHNYNYGKTVEIADITEKYNYSATLEREVENRTHKIRSIQRSVIASFAQIVEARDNSTGEHVKRMSKYVEILARQMKSDGLYPEILTDAYIDRLVEVAPLHDIGKLTVPDRILLKPGRLTPEEFEVIKTHTVNGADIIRDCLEDVEKPDYVKLAVDIVRYHHEKWSGGGYPANMKGEEIPLSARIVAVADVYDAIRSKRCYKPAMTPEEAREVIFSGEGNHFDPSVVGAFRKALDVIESI